MVDIFLFIRLNLEQKHIKVGHYHLWFIPMLIGLYIITPLLRMIVSNRSRLFYFFGMSAMTNIGMLIMYKVPYVVGMYGFIGKLQVHFFSGWVFYYVLGYAIDSIEINKKCCRSIYFGALISQLVTIATYVYHAKRAITIDHIFDDYSVNRFLYVIAIFIFIKNISLKIDLDHVPLISATICKISSLTLGAYLIHAAVIEKRKLIYCVLDKRNPLWAIPCMTLIVALIAFMITWVLKRMPVIKRWLL